MPDLSLLNVLRVSLIGFHNIVCITRPHRFSLYCLHYKALNRFLFLFHPAFPIFSVGEWSKLRLLLLPETKLHTSLLKSIFNCQIKFPQAGPQITYTWIIYVMLVKIQIPEFSLKSSWVRIALWISIPVQWVPIFT